MKFDGVEISLVKDRGRNSLGREISIYKGVRWEEKG